MLDHAGAWRVYLGGRSIRALRGENAPVDDHFPEEWIASTVEAAGAGALPGAGLSRLREAPYSTLRDKIASAPGFWLGEEFVRQHGPDCGVLLKLLDAAERLNVQVHPSRDDARRFWGSPYGKLECWHFLDGRSINGQPPYFYLGLRQDVDKAKLQQAFYSGDFQRVLDCMYRFPAIPGQTVLVESGVPHAIGAGCFLMELQEPSDLTLRLEKRTASGTEVSDDCCHMGAGYDALFSMVRYEHFTEEETQNAYFIPARVLKTDAGGTMTQLLGYDRCPYFSMEEIQVRTALTLKSRPAFYGLFVLSGHGSLQCGEKRMSLTPGDQIFVPGGTPAITLASNLRLIRFFGPQ